MLSRKFSLRAILLTLISLVIAGALIGTAVIALGLPTVSARPPHMKITTFLLHTVFKRSVAARADVEPPADFLQPGRVKLGAQHYANVCAKCHGGPGLGQNTIALSMRPRPQHLPDVVGEFSDPELYVILRDGVRFSAMPAWPTTRNLDEIWSVVAFLRQLPEMDAETYLAMTEPPGVQAPTMPHGPVGPLADSDTGIKAPPLDEYLYAVPATEWAAVAASGAPVETCARCHGADGSGAATDGWAPNLTVQPASYISDALRAYATGKRESGIMKVVAAGLSAQQIDALAAYYDALPDVGATLLPAVAALIPQGSEIAHKGKPLGAVAPCLDCHQRAKGRDGVLPIPQLAGQNPAYLESQLRSFAGDSRSPVGIYNPMIHEARGLTPEDRASVAAYFASLPVGTVADIPPFVPDVAKAEDTVNRVCSKCHQSSGAGVASGEYPNLTLQTPQYIAHQLHSFAADQRNNERMLQVARSLQEDEIDAIAAYFGTGPALPTPGTVDATAVAAGQGIAENGLAAANVPACLTCHGAANLADLPLVAHLQGQNATYLKGRLDHFARESSLPLPGLNPMHPIAAALTDQQRAEVAAYFASLPPLPK